MKGGPQGLDGERKPLSDRPADAFVSPGDAAGFRIMAEGGVLPEDITLNKQAAEQAAQLASLPEGPERKSALARLADLQMRQAVAEEARRRFLKS